MSKLPKVNADFPWPEVSDPGIKNMVRGALVSSLQPLLFIEENIMKQLVPASPKDLARNAGTYIQRAKDILSGDPLKVVVKSIIESNGIKIPDPTALAKQTLPDANIDLSSVSGLPEIMTGIFKEVVEGKVIATDAVKSAVDGIREKVKKAAGEKSNQLNWIGDWYQQTISMITLVLSVPMFIVKLIIDFVKKIIEDVMGTLSKLMSEKQAFITNFIAEKIEDLVNSASKMLGLDVSIPGVETPPLPGFVSCLLKTIKSIITGFPANMSGLQKELVIS
jgi:hypothetical protein